MKNFLQRLAPSALLLLSRVEAAIPVPNMNSRESVKNAAATVAYWMMTQYTGNLTGGTPGFLPQTAPNGQTYYWWECGAMFGSLIDYWYLTGDSSYNEPVTQGMLFQVGQNQNYEPRNVTLQLGNDDQAFWGMAAMSAAENDYPNPPKNKPQWLALAQAVFNSQAAVWDWSTCHGGLRWQIPFTNGGWNYKNTISNGCFFQLSARLARYTGNNTYQEWAERAWNWTTGVGLIESDYQIIDGAMVPGNCTTTRPYIWTYNTGVFLYGAAVMYNITKSDLWKSRVDGLLEGAFRNFFKNDIMTEVQCEPTQVCNTDQVSYKAYLSRWMGLTAVVAPWTYSQIMHALSISAVAAVKTCTGGDNGNMCGDTWLTGTYEPAGSWGVGQQLSVLEVVQSTLWGAPKSPLTKFTGGTSKGNPSAGGAPIEVGDDQLYNIDTGDKAGAGILTILMALTTIGGAAWMIT